LTQARAEIVLARGNWEEALSLAQEAIEHSLLRGRVKYQVLGLQTRAQALEALSQKHEAIASLERAVSLARRTRDPAMFLRAALALLPLDGNDALREEAMITAEAIAEALPDEHMKRQFLSAEALRMFKT
jgi:tetratricopeptide (TPR) repeat protein